ncbi:MAG: hypothetical protein U0637_11730 [Phycisphaerales bacterium]
MRRLAFLACALAAPAALAQTLTTAFTFQGEVRSAGLPAPGPFDARFRLFADASGSLQLGPTLCVDNLAVSEGRFTALLDFGPVFTGTQAFVEMDIRQDTGLACADTTGYTTLAPRTQLTAAPHATFALSAAELNGQPASFYTSAANLTGTVPDARLSANVPLLNSTNLFGLRQLITSSSAADANALLVTQNNNNTSQAIRGVTTGGTALVHGGLFEATNSTSGVGVQGQALAATGATKGVWGKVNSATGWAGYFEGRGYFTGSLGVGTDTPEAPFHVMEGSAGTVTGNANASAIFERSSANYLHLLTPDASEKGVIFGSPANSVQAGIFYTNGVSLNFRTGGNAIKLRITDAGDVGIGVITPAARLDVDGAIHSATGFRFPDGRTQTFAALDPGDTGVVSGYPAGTTVAITINATAFPTAKLVGGFKLSRPLSGGIPSGQLSWTERPVLRRPRTSDNTWYEWVRNGTTLSNLVITVTTPSGGTCTCTLPAGNAFLYRTVVGDDGLPFEEVSYACPNVANGLSTDPCVTAGSLTGITTPTFSPRLGASTGLTGVYRLVVANVIDPTILVAGAPQFSAAIDSATGARTGTVGTATFLVRGNAASAAQNLDFWTLANAIRSVRLIVDTTTDYNLFNNQNGATMSWGMRTADDGLPVEEAEIVVNMVP